MSAVAPPSVAINPATTGVIGRFGRDALGSDVLGWDVLGEDPCCSGAASSVGPVGGCGVVAVVVVVLFVFWSWNVSVMVRFFRLMRFGDFHHGEASSLGSPAKA
jgi:hypothetical protein